LVVALVLFASSAAFAAVDFEQSVGPLLTRRCLSCHHGPDARGGLDLSTSEGLRRGGGSGPAIGEEGGVRSLLLERVKSGEMPASSQGDPQPLPAEEVDVLRAWVAAGAPWPAGRVLDPYERTTEDRAGRDWWSLQPLRPGPPPELNAREPSHNPIDAFVLATLQRHQRTLSPPADRRVLMRRAMIDLVGIAPTFDQLEAFAADPAPDAYERLVDQLLSSPRYGERWGRYWLDLARYADTCGYERDQFKPNIWRYRDWVIEGLNADMPYDRFVTEQLAGDEVPWRSESSVIATGMLRAGTWNDEPNDPEDYRYERLEDFVHTTTSAFLGMTVKCARCHDHKFDPIRQSDYYRIASFFWAGYLGQANLGGPSKDELGYDVFGWTDRNPAPEPIRLLRAGQRLSPGDEVSPGFLSAIPALDQPLVPPPDGSRTTQRRLQFARWLLDPRHPLTARVFVNRLWQHHFGEAIVRTPNNFGRKSDPPTHPELLDWLAQELIRGEWQVKRLHRLIMTSRVYRQASTHPRHTQLEQEDYANRTWWHYPRRRLDAESLRDNLLAASGTLDLRMGGPSFFPRMSAEALEGLSRKGSDWQESPADQQGRRSVYMVNKRSRLLPMMTAFDFSDTTLTCAQRDVTTVAPQALAMLNNEFVHEQSERMAVRILEQAGVAREQQAELAWKAALARRPRPEELQSACEHLAQQLDHFTRRNAGVTPAFTGNTGPGSTDPGSTAHGEMATARRQALASLCHVLLNTNEFLYTD
jgi:hypothetical protein